MYQNTLHSFFDVIAQQMSDRFRVEKVADSLSQIDIEQRILAFQLLGKGVALATLEYLTPTEQSELLLAMDADELIELLESMKPEERMELFAHLPNEVVEQLMAKLHLEFQTIIHSLFGRCLINL
ncbi:hypothetical protein FRE64_08515 [Euhalothece natronophila Z-M001]|uniref:Magnesium transporter MgtE intracellular domain-containing protein n=1 Tax=Euhalothece natronophila Z-M001 TaxID=522448 RepID=A0A5B8NLV1_9CHRO|nr:hypothetical protein [Euhalothece natronophila]QDZ39978.1 hypothetical protein FRE64_08515 [Euhalothece natronophila Z-M001]